jgi:type II restriction enzyme
MVSPLAERAVADCIQNGKALLKFISSNDAGATGSHQCGFYMPKKAHKLYTIYPPIKGENKKHPVKITWQDGRETDSMVTWYGAKKDEYRLTRFGKEFPFLTPDAVGSLFVLIPWQVDEFLAYIFDTDDDIEYVQSAIGAEVVDVWSVYDGNEVVEESDEECLQRLFREFAAQLSDFPTGAVFSKYTWESLVECVNGFEGKTTDNQVIRLVQEECKRSWARL